MVLEHMELVWRMEFGWTALGTSTPHEYPTSMLR